MYDVMRLTDTTPFQKILVKYGEDLESSRLALRTKMSGAKDSAVNHGSPQL